MEPSSDSSPEVARRRRSSLPSDDNNSLKSIDTPGGKISLELGNVKRTRSSTSIQELMDKEKDETEAANHTPAEAAQVDFYVKLSWCPIGQMILEG